MALACTERAGRWHHVAEIEKAAPTPTLNGISRQAASALKSEAMSTFAIGAIAATREIGIEILTGEIKIPNDDPVSQDFPRLLMSFCESHKGKAIGEL